MDGRSLRLCLFDEGPWMALRSKQNEVPPGSQRLTGAFSIEMDSWGDKSAQKKAAMNAA